MVSSIVSCQVKCARAGEQVAVGARHARASREVPKVTAKSTPDSRAQGSSFTPGVNFEGFCSIFQGSGPNLNDFFFVGRDNRQRITHKYNVALSPTKPESPNFSLLQLLRFPITECVFTLPLPGFPAMLAHEMSTTLCPLFGRGDGTDRNIGGVTGGWSGDSTLSTRLFLAELGATSLSPSSAAVTMADLHRRQQRVQMSFRVDQNGQTRGFLRAPPGHESKGIPAQMYAR